MKRIQDEEYVAEEGYVIWTDGNGVKHRFVNPLLDKGFKITLGSVGSEEHLKNLLNRILPDVNIVNLRYINTERHGMTVEEGKSVFDVYCEDSDGVKFLVEMQNWSQKHFHKRAVYYSSLIIQDQAARARREQKILSEGNKKWDYNYHPLFVVSFLNYKNWTPFSSSLRRNEFISTYRYLDIETKEELGDGTNLVFIDLHGFRKNIEDCKSLEDIWMYSIKNMFTMGECPEIIKGTEIEELYTLSEFANMTLEQRLKIEESIMTQNDILNSIAEQIQDAREEAIAIGQQEGMAKGMAEGRAEGRAQGRAEGRAEVIKQLLTSGMAAEDIAAALGVSVEELK